MNQRDDQGYLRIFGIPIAIDRSWFLVVGLLSYSLARSYFPNAVPNLSSMSYWLMGILSSLLLFACVLLHELGHSLIAKKSGVDVYGVKLFMFGGVARIGCEPPRPSSEFAITLSGLLVSALIAGCCFASARFIGFYEPRQSAVVAILRYLAVINSALLVFNLLPGFPLDGGRLLRAALWSASGNFRGATRIASLAGMLLGFALLGFGLWAISNRVWFGGMWYIFLGIFLFNAASVSYRRTMR